MKRLILMLFVFCGLPSAGEPFDMDSASAVTELHSIPVKPSKVEWNNGKLSRLRFDKTNAFGGEELWGLLDWVGGEAAWMEIDLGGLVAPEIRAVIGKSTQAWFRQSPGSDALVATLAGKASASLDVHAIRIISKEVKVPLECRYQGQQEPFDDFVLENSGLCALNSKEVCHYVHREDSRLRLDASKQAIHWVIRIPDPEPFPLVPNFRNLAQDAQRRTMDDYLSYFNHELGLAVRSFVESTPGIFNWQIWHWYNWGPDSGLSRTELRALLESGQQPGKLDIFSSSCKDGRKVRIWSDAHGTLGMDLQ